MPNFNLDIFRGSEINLPGTAGFFRGLLEAFTIGGLAAVAQLVTNADLTVLGLTEESMPIAIGLVLIAIRTLEGFADQIDPKNKRARE